jgi:hypothetical protein
VGLVASGQLVCSVTIVLDWALSVQCGARVPRKLLHAIYFPWIPHGTYRTHPGIYPLKKINSLISWQTTTDQEIIKVAKIQTQRFSESSYVASLYFVPSEFKLLSSVTFYAMF